MNRHWPSGPYMVDPGQTTHCFKFWCTVLKRHEHYGNCTCGYEVRTRRLDDCADAMHAHLREAR